MARSPRPCCSLHADAVLRELTQGDPACGQPDIGAGPIEHLDDGDLLASARCVFPKPVGLFPLSGTEISGPRALIVPILTRKVEGVSMPTAPPPMTTMFFPAEVFPASTSHAYSTLSAFIPGIRGHKGSPPVARMTTSGFSAFTRTSQPRCRTESLHLRPSPARQRV